MPDDPTQPSKPWDKPDQIDPTEGAVPEATELFSPGEAAPVEGRRALYGYRNERLPKRYQDIFRNLCQKIAERDLFARIDEILRAAEQRFYWRSMFDVYFNEQNYVWELPQGHGSDSGDERLSYAFNIYQAYGRGFISQVGHPPNVRFEAAEQDSAEALQIASAANTKKKKIESVNDIGQLSKEVARLMYTDGRVALYGRRVTDGARFGYQDAAPVDEAPEGLGQGQAPPPKQPRRPKGGEVLDAYGVLEVRVPVTLRRLCDFPFLQLSYEIDLTTAKSMYPHISNTVSGITPGPGEYEFDAVTRVAINQGLRLLTQTGDTVHQIPTWQRTWMRPAMWAEIENKDERLFFEQNFPDGALVAFVGETYAESRNESMDDHWQVLYPIEGDGQQTPSVGYVMMAVQDALCDLTDLQMEMAMKAIPAIYMDKGTFDLQALSKQKAGHGAHFPTMTALPPEVDIRTKAWAEPTTELQASTVAFYQLLWGDIPQFLTGLFPSVLGATDPANQTKGGILALADASRGYQGPAWRSWQSAYSKSIEQLVRISAYFAQADENPDETDRILADLRPGSFYAMPDSDQNLPQTFEEQQKAYQLLFASAATGFQPAMETIMEAKNRLLGKKYLGVPDLVIPGAQDAEKQMREITQLLAEVPIPNLEAQQVQGALKLAALVAGAAPPPDLTPEQAFTPSIDIDPQFDDNAVQAQTGKDWVNSPEGQQAARDNPQGFMNVRLHVLKHMQAAEQEAQQQTAKMAQAAAAPKVIEAQAKAAVTPQKKEGDNISANFKDFPTMGKVQIAARRGIQLDPGEIEAHDAKNKPKPIPLPS